MRPRLFLTRELPPKPMALLRAEFDLTVNPHDRVLTRDELLAGARNADALLCTLMDVIDAPLLAACPQLKVVANFAVGYNNIDVPAASARRLPVTNTPGVLTEATADLAFALLLDAARRVSEGDRFVRTRQWQGWAPLQYLGADVTGATLGLVGLGRIAEAVARRARGFDMTLLYWSRTRLAPAREATLGLTYRPLDELLAAADFVSVHVALTPDTRHLLDARRLALLKPTAILINTARGPIVDEKALVQALRAGSFAGAGLDVFEREPVLEPELYAMENVVIPPHLGSATIGTRTKMGLMAVENCLAACQGRRPPNLVNPEVWPA